MLMMWGYAFHSGELLGLRSRLPSFLTAAVALGSAADPQAVSVMLSLASMLGNIGGGALSDG
jgi:hypothetical protein